MADLVRTTVLCRPDGTVQEWYHGARDPAHLDPALRVLRVDTPPRDRDAWRWDGATGLRPETAQEQSAREAAAKATRAEAELATTRAAEALVAVLAGKLGVDPVTLRDEVLAELQKTVTVATGPERVG